MKKLILLILVAILVTILLANAYMNRPVLKTGKSVFLMVYPGESLNRILIRADSLDLAISGTAVKLFFRAHRADRRIVSGRYAINETTTRWGFINLLENGAIDYVWVTIPEGLTLNRIIELLARKTGRSPAEFALALHNPDFLASLPFSPVQMDGYFFPETYKVPYYADPRYLIKAVTKTLQRFLSPTLMARATRINLAPEQLLTLASLIQAETADPQEMRLISSVFHNRLRKQMSLQCDPTVIYALGGLDRPLLSSDLKYDSPYNTYLYRGLPPAPINSPGKQAILAALYPDSTEYLFFVADTNGRHIFSFTNAQHEKARREIKRKKLTLK